MKKYNFEYCMKHLCNGCKKIRECDAKIESKRENHKSISFMRNRQKKLNRIIPNAKNKERNLRSYTFDWIQ